MNKEKEHALHKAFEQFMDMSLMQMHITEDADKVIAKDIMGYGTTLDEVINSFEDWKALVHLQIEQGAQLEFRFDRHPYHKRISDLEDTALIVETIATKITAEGFKNEFTFRISVLLEYTSQDIWQVIHWHGSIPSDTENDSWHVNEWKKKNELLEKEVQERTAELEAKNRELEIESAVEKVRNNALAMHSPNDIMSVLEVLNESISGLNLNDLSPFIWIKEEDGWFTQYDISKVDSKGSVANFNFRIFPAKYPQCNKGFKRVLSGENYFITKYAGQNLVDIAEEVHDIDPGSGKLFKAAIKEGHITEYYQATACFKHGAVGLDYNFLPDVSIEGILTKMAEAIGLAYQRVDELQESIKRRKDAELEASVERVRAHAMGMQTSNDLPIVLQTLHEEFQKLDLEGHYTSSIMIEKDRYHIEALNIGEYDSTQGTNVYSETINIKQFNLFESLIKGWRSSPEYFVDYVSLERIHQHGKELRQVEKYASYADTWDAAIREGKFNQLWVVSAGFGEGLLGGDFLVEPDEWVKKVLTKMAGAFGLAYQRFADLQKAEAQAREAQIETALERIRSKTMGMQKSEDLADISLELVKQVQELGKKVWFCAFNIYDDDPQGSLEWGSNGQGTFPKYRTPREGVFLHYYKAGQQGESLLINEIGQEECPSHYDYLCSLPGVGEQLLEMKANGIPFPKSQIDHVAFFKFGYVLFITYDPAPEAHDIFKRFAKVFEQSYTRFLDLQKAEAQAREAQIEAALEKVRAQAMAMHNSEDMGQCILKMFSELTALGVDKGTRFGIGILNDENENNQLWTAIKEGEEINMHIGNLDMSWHPLLQSARKAWKSQVPLHKYVLEGEDLLNYYKMINEAPDYKLQVAIDKLPEREIHYGFIFKHGFFYAFCPNEFQPELIHITQRFSSLFSQTYTRFLDLKKAEAQAREAQIEASLERVRSRSLAMHKSEELEEVILVVSEQLQQLQFKFHNVSFGFDNEQMGLNFWLASPGLPKPFLIKVPYIDNPAINRPIEARNNGIDFNADILSREENIQFLQHMFDHSDLSHLPVKTKNFLMSTTGIARSQCLMKNTILTIANYALSPYSEEQNAILRRFGNVFEQAYVRFLDLKKAEAQAKEAQVALSLERIRAQVTAMQESSDLFDIVVSMRKEFLSMGHEADYFWHMQWLPDAYDMSMTSDDGSRVGMVISIPKFVHEAIPDLDKWEKGDESICVLPLNADAAWDYIENMNTHGRYELADPNAPSQEDIQHIGGLTFIIARTTHGEIGYSLAGEVPNPPKDALNTLERFAGVFDLAYKRFEDLKASEHQHRETQIELSLERIRAQAMAMKVSTDLLDIVVKMRTEFITLGHEAQYFWYMRWFPQKYEKAMTSGDGTKVGMVMELPRHMHGDIKLLADWEKSQEATVVYAMDPDMAVDYVDKMVALGDFKQVDPNAPSADDIRHIGGLTFIMTKTTFGEIGYSLPGVVPNPPADDLNTLKRFASAFDLAYGRFEDLQKAEAQAIRAKKDLEAIKIARKKAEDALTELKSTQSQLIQSEKMASLGELTAGIAHEIQNPLNFVNNFSEVSNEMIKELQEERAKAKNEQDESLIDEILIDIEQNLSKINHHGNRAGDIVKGMLQHSRAGSGTKELTDINLLADEYLRLAYHGLRAKDKSFNATMKTEFDESIGNINIIPQDIGRVILNLITNAFYAVNEKNKQSIAGYEPTVTVTTSKGGEGIRGINNIIKITVKDNGNGIPQKILDKIFQPFFTTKPTGQGTGLGLSLSYDIVKAHGGELKVETKEGEGLPAGASAQAGSEFRILLPIV